MRTTIFSSTLLLLPSLARAQQETQERAINITENDTADLVAGTGNLGWGASGLAFGYSAGVGLNFSSGE